MLFARLCVAGVCLGVLSIAAAQEFFDFGSIQGLPDEPDVQIDVDSTILGIVTATTRVTDPATADLLANLEGVRVRVYNSIEDSVAVAEYLDAASNLLAQDDWQQVVRVQDDGDVRIYIQSNGDAVTGLTAMIVNDSDAVFVSVAGSITPDQIAQAMAMVGADDILESIGEIGAQSLAEANGAN